MYDVGLRQCHPSLADTDVFASYALGTALRGLGPSRAKDAHSNFPAENAIFPPTDMGIIRTNI